MNHDNIVGGKQLTVLLEQNMAGDRKGVIVSFAQMKQILPNMQNLDFT